MVLLPFVPGPDGGPFGQAVVIRSACERFLACATKGELGIAIALEIERYSVFDLQVLCGRLHHEVEQLPSPYREAVRPYFIEQLFGRHHCLLLMLRSGAFDSLNRPVADPELFSEFLMMVPEACFCRDIQSDYIPDFSSPYQGFFYYLIAAFSMFVLDQPGHPAGMPFPGGFRVEDRGGVYYCPVRDKEKEVRYSICNFCPAKQSDLP